MGLLRLGLCIEYEEDPGLSGAGEEKRDEGVDDLSTTEAVDESLSLEGILDCELVEGE